MPGVTTSRTTGGGKRANERPTQERLLKRTTGGGRSGKKTAAAAEARKSTDHEQDTAADDNRAIAAAVDTGESPQEQLQKDTKQAGLEVKGKSSGADKTGGRGQAKEVELDKSDHGNGKPAGAKSNGAASGKGAETKAAKVACHPKAMLATHLALLASPLHHALADLHASQSTHLMQEEARQHPGKVVKINRAPVLTLWAKKVAEREGWVVGSQFNVPDYSTVAKRSPASVFICLLAWLGSGSATLTALILRWPQV